MVIGCLKEESLDRPRQVGGSELFWTWIMVDLFIVVFVESGALSKAMVAYEKALEWQCLFDLAVRTEIPEEDLVAMGYRVGGTCVSFLALASC